MPGCAVAPAAPKPRCAVPAAAGSPTGVIGSQLGDDLTGYHQPFHLVLGIGKLLAQQLDFAGQLGHPAG